MKKTLIGLLLLAVLLGCLVACNAPEQEPDDTTEQTTEPTTEATTTTAEATEPAEPEAQILLSALANYTIVRPESANFTTLQSAYTLQGALKDMGDGVECTVKSDMIKEGFPQFSLGEYEILIGDTNREETIAYKKTLRYHDYGYALIGQKIVIFGFGGETVEKAVNLFISNVVEGSFDDGVFFSESNAVTEEGSYDINKATLAGNPIRSCVIVYPEDGFANAETLAEELSDYLTETTGFWVTYQSDAEEIPEGSYEILIGANDAEGIPADLEANEAYIVSDEDRTLITGGGNLGFYHAYVLFKEAFVTETSRITVDFEEPVRDDTEEQMLRVMSFNVLCSSVTETRTKNVPLCIRNYMPDVLGIQEGTDYWMGVLKEQLPEYNCVGVGRNASLNGEHSAIFYKRAMFTLLDSGTYWLSDTPTVAGSKFEDSNYIRIMTYAVLQRKSDGETFFYANTHLDSYTMNTKQIKVLFSLIEQYNPENYPVILTGDFNLQPTTSNYTYIKNAGFVDTSRVAETVDYDFRVADMPYTTGNEDGGNIIDYVFVKMPNVCVEKYRVCNERMDNEFPSDHRAIFSDIYLN